MTTSYGLLKKERREERERLSKLAKEARLRLEEEAAANCKDKLKDGLHINTTVSSLSPTSDRRRPGPLDLTRSASPVVAALATVIADIATVSYPEGYHSPNPDLNQNVENGKFRYV
jgi:hypothetical protein